MGYKSPRTICLSGLPSVFSPAVTTTYYWGACNLVPSATEGPRQIFIPWNGIIRKATLTSYSATTAGTGEAWTFTIFKNGATDYTFDSQSLAAARRNWTNFNLNIPVEKGDTISFKSTTPNWVTPPVNMYTHWFIILDVE